MTTTLRRTPVRSSIAGRVDGLCPAVTARPSGEPCDVRTRNRMSLSPFIFFASACNVAASALRVAPPPVLVLNLTTTGPCPNRLPTICAAPVASLRKTPWSPNSPNDTTVTLRASSARTGAHIVPNVTNNSSSSPSSSWSSTRKPRASSASKFHRRCSPALTR